MRYLQGMTTTATILAIPARRDSADPSAVPVWFPEALYHATVNAAATIFRVLVPILLAPRWNTDPVNRAANLRQVARLTTEWAARVRAAALQFERWQALCNIRDGIRVVSAAA